MKKIVSTLFLVTLFSGCAGQSKELNCGSEDWTQLGYKTATDGDSVRTFEKYKQQCASTISDVEKQLFLDGFTKGIIEYCTFDNGYKIGASNRAMTKTCPPELVGIFTRGYKSGRLELAEKKRRLDRLSEAQEDLTAGGNEPMVPPSE